MHGLGGEPEFTHNGWFSFCPIKVAELDSDAPIIACRWWLLTPLMWLAEIAEGVTILLRSIFLSDYEPRWWFRIAGERK